MDSSPQGAGESRCGRTAELCKELGACAAGYWRLDPESDRLVQVAFAAGEGLDREVARQFAAATVSVSLDQRGLGIVTAALTGQPSISEVEVLPADSGSGKWLRAFGASRSVAVPIRGPAGAVLGVFSVALPRECRLDDRAVIGQIGESANPGP
jgi:hypothetical protein